MTILGWQTIACPTCGWECESPALVVRGPVHQNFDPDNPPLRNLHHGTMEMHCDDCQSLFTIDIDSAEWDD